MADRRPGGAAPVTILTSLASYWNMDEASGVRADALGVSPLTDNNTVTAVAGKVGNAAQFVKANAEYLSHADSADLRVGVADFTFAFWYQRTLAFATFGLVLAKGGQQDYTCDNNAGSLRFYTRNGGAFPTATWGSALTTGQWYFVVGWRDGTAQTVNLQLDNGAVVSASLAGAPVANDTAGVFAFGAASGGGSPTDQLIDEAGFWKRVLTPAERTRLYNGGAGVTYPAF